MAIGNKCLQGATQVITSQLALQKQVRVNSDFCIRVTNVSLCAWYVSLRIQEYTIPRGLSGQQTGCVSLYPALAAKLASSLWGWKRKRGRGKEKSSVLHFYTLRLSRTMYGMTQLVHSPTCRVVGKQRLLNSILQPVQLQLYQLYMYMCQYIPSILYTIPISKVLFFKLKSPQAQSEILLRLLLLSLSPAHLLQYCRN